MNEEIEVELRDKSILLKKAVIVKIQALWRGYLTRKSLRKLQGLYSQIFKEIEEPPSVVPYWPPETYRKPLFLSQSDYHTRKSADEKQILEKTPNTLSTGSGGALETEVEENHVPVEGWSTNESKSRAVHSSDTEQSVTQRKPNNETVRTNDNIVDFSNNANITLGGGDEAGCSIKEDFVENKGPTSHVDSAQSVAVINEASNVCDNDSVQKDSRVADEGKENLLTQGNNNNMPVKNTSSSVQTGDLQEEASSKGETEPAVNGVQPLKARVLDSRMDNLDTEQDHQEPVRLGSVPSSVNEDADNTLSHPLQQTTYWESEKTENSEEYDLSGMSKEELKKQRSLVGMELLWVQQAIESRKQYLRLKADIST